LVKTSVFGGPKPHVPCASIRPVRAAAELLPGEKVALMRAVDFTCWGDEKPPVARICDLPPVGDVVDPDGRFGNE